MSDTKHLSQITARLDQLIALIERAVPPAPPTPDFDKADAFVWHMAPDQLEAVAKVNRVDIGLLQGVDRLRDQLVDNTAALCQWVQRQQRTALGRKRHGQVVACQGGAGKGERRS